MNNPDATENGGVNLKEPTPPNSPGKTMHSRRRASTTEKFKSMFRGSKRSKKGKQKKLDKASSDTELPTNPSPPNLEELYSKVNKKTKIKEKAFITMKNESPLEIAPPLPERDHLVRQKEYYSDPSNVFNSIDIIVESRNKTKRLKTRSERGSGRRSQQEDSFSSSGEEFQDTSSIRKSSKNSKNSKSSFTDVTEDRATPAILSLPPPPSRPPSDASGVRTPISQEHKLSSPRPIKKSSKKYSKHSPIVHDAHFDFKPIINGNSVLLPERQITILKLKTNSSSDYTEEEPASPPTRDGVSLSHPKKRLSVGSPPASTKDLDNSFLFPDKEVSAHSLPIKGSNMDPIYQSKADNSKQTTLKVVTKVVSEVGTSMQPYVNVPQLVKTEEVEYRMNLSPESLNSNSPEGRQGVLQDRASQTDSPTSILTDLSISREGDLPPRPRKPPSLMQQNCQFKQTKLKSSLKRKTDNNSISSTCSSTGFEDFDPNQSERPNLKVNFGGTTEILITPNSTAKNVPDNRYTYKTPNAAHKEGLHGYLDFTVPYGGYAQHIHFSSDPHIGKRIAPQPVYYPSSLHVPSMVPNPYDYEGQVTYLDEAFEHNQVHPVYSNSGYREPLAIQYDYNGGIPVYPAAHPFMSYSTDPNMRELRSGAYSGYSMQSYQQNSPMKVGYKPSRPAPAPPRNPPNSRYQALRNANQVPIAVNNNNNHNIKIATNQETSV